jgi:hypothetical protein
MKNGAVATNKKPPPSRGDGLSLFVPRRLSTVSRWLETDGAQNCSAVLCQHEIIHGTAGNIFELLIRNRFRGVRFFAHSGV